MNGGCKASEMSVATSVYSELQHMKGIENILILLIVWPCFL